MSSVLRAPNGSKVQVRTGVMRGVGPQGPIGPQGPAGAAGPAGPTGPPGTVNDVNTNTQSLAAVGVADDNWYDAAVGGLSPINNQVLSFIDDYQFQFKDPNGAYLVIVNTRYQPTHGTGVTGTSTGTRRCRIADAGGTQLGRLIDSIAAAPFGETAFAIADIIRNPDPSKIYKVQLRSHDDIATTNDLRNLQVIRIGSGPAGIAGPIGPAGATGPQGPTGPTGSAGGGYTTYNALIGGGDSSAAPPYGSGSDWVRTTDQGIAYPRPNELPSTPFFLKRSLNDLEPKLVRRYTNSADRSAKRAAAAGDVTYLGDTGQLQHREKSGTDLDIARVHVDSVAAPAGTGVAAPGALWVQV